jgi:hypothetical protein
MCLAQPTALCHFSFVQVLGRAILCKKLCLPAAPDAARHRQLKHKKKDASASAIGVRTDDTWHQLLLRHDTGRMSQRRIHVGSYPRMVRLVREQEQVSVVQWMRNESVRFERDIPMWQPGNNRVGISRGLVHLPPATAHDLDLYFHLWVYVFCHVRNEFVCGSPFRPGRW